MHYSEIYIFFFYEKQIFIEKDIAKISSFFCVKSFLKRPFQCKGRKEDAYIIKYNKKNRKLQESFFFVIFYYIGIIFCIVFYY